MFTATVAMMACVQGSSFEAADCQKVEWQDYMINCCPKGTFIEWNGERIEAPQRPEQCGPQEEEGVKERGKSVWTTLGVLGVLIVGGGYIIVKKIVLPKVRNRMANSGGEFEGEAGGSEAEQVEGEAGEKEETQI